MMVFKIMWEVYFEIWYQDMRVSSHSWHFMNIKNRISRRNASAHKISLYPCKCIRGFIRSSIRRAALLAKKSANTDSAVNLADLST